MDSVGIPRQLILTGPGSFLQDLPLEVQRNVEDIITANPTLNVQWFSDADCYSYISYYYDSELAGMFRREFRGSFRGDLCRAAVLYREGGFYVDLDFELLVPLTTLIGVSTPFSQSLQQMVLSWMLWWRPLHTATRCGMGASDHLFNIYIYSTLYFYDFYILYTYKDIQYIYIISFFLGSRRNTCTPEMWQISIHKVAFTRILEGARPSWGFGDVLL